MRRGWNRVAIGAAIWVWLAAAVGAAGGSSPLVPEELAARVRAVRPSEDELRWRKIPWVTDLAEGARLAREERRPIFLWVAGDEPLERC